MNISSATNLSASQELIARARAGDAGACAQLRVLYAPRVRAFAGQCLQVAAPGRTAEAVLDEAFARLADFDVQHGTFDVWLKRIAERRCRARRQSRRLAYAVIVLLLTVLGMTLLLSPSQPTSAYPATLYTPRPTSVAGERPTRPAGPTPVPASPVPTIVPTAGPRVNLLVMGVDHRPDDPNPPLTDAMMLVSLDPRSGDAAVLSIPRDLYVDVPGYGPNRINTAYYFGEMYDEPDGGTGLAIRTVESAFGVQVDHWAVFRFAAFEQGVDLLGGVDVEVARDIYDPAYPTADYGTEVFKLEAGPQHLDGTTALKYVRTRHGDSDLQRNARQRQVLLGIRERLGDPGTVAALVPRLPGFLAGLGDNLYSDLSAQQMIQLGLDALKIDTSRIRQLALGPGDVSDYTTPGGAQVLMPNWPRVNAIMREFLDGPCATCPPATAQAAQPLSPPRRATATASPLEQLRGENARVQVLNGTESAGLAEQVAERLRRAGANVVSTGDAVRRDYPATYVFAYAQKPVTLAAIAEMLGVPPGNRYAVNPDGGVYDIQIIIGADYQP